jgi:hypothetical protein
LRRDSTERGVFFSSLPWPAPIPQRGGQAPQAG